MAEAASAIPQCPLCGAAAGRLVATIRASELRAAWKASGVSFSDVSWKVFGQHQTVSLCECGACGFHFCPPELAGDGQFYAELERQRTSYYPTDVPEFTRTLAWIRPLGLRTVLDIGCGDGAFLDRARGAGLTTSGLELNLAAAESARRKGHQVETRTLQEFAADPNRARPDLVTLFQVIEHVSDPVEFLRLAVRVVKEGGYVSVAVPNERGIYRICPWEPHEWPPHHVTRWRLADLQRLGARAGLELVHTGTNRLSGNEIKHFWQLHNRIAAAIGRKPYPGGALLPAVLGFTYRKLGLKFIVPGLGTSVYAFYRKP